MTTSSVLTLIKSANALGPSLGDIEEVGNDQLFELAEDVWCRLEDEVIDTPAVNLADLAGKVRQLFLAVNATGYFEPPADDALKAERLACSVLRDVEMMFAKNAS